jgi:DHA1 family bicyclomycin/chloramphenicol resistance-like MFS transporter
VAQRAPLVLLLAALSAFGPVSMDTYLPGLPELGRDLGAPPWQAGLTLTACLIGLATGQLLAGPVSDARGRRRPLLAGLALFVAASLACAAAPDIWTLTGARLIQGAAGAAGIVIARAIVRDLYSGSEMARFFAVLVLVNGLSPILAPLVGAQLLAVTDWRGIFVVLAGFGLVLLAASAFGLRETLPPDRRHGGGLASTLRVFRALIAEREFTGYVLACGFAMAAMFAYIAGSPFVLQEIHGVSATGFSVAFATNAAGIMAFGALSSRLVVRTGPARLLKAGLAIQAAGAAALLASVLADAPLAALLVSLFAVVSSIGLVLPNATALALADHPRTAGSASALLGLAQFVFGAMAAPLVGIGGTGTALPMAIVIAVAAAAAGAAAYSTAA